MKKLITTTLFVASALHVFGANEVPQKIDVDNLPAAVMSDVIVPVPSEIFGILNKLGSPKWNEVIREQKVRASADRAHTALLLGTVIADGFIAVQAQNREQVQEIGRDVLKLAGAIGVRKSVISRSNSIIDAAEKEDWMLAKKEFDGALSDVKEAMVELRDEQLAQLVSLGGWLRGTEVLTRIVNEDYTSDGAELLHQPALVDYFSSQIDAMDSKVKDTKLVLEISNKLNEIKPMITVDDGREISADRVKKINTITAELVESISAA